MGMVSLSPHFALLLLLANLVTSSFATTDDLVINTQHGKVKGMSLTLLGGRVRAFLGIPYAKPPLKELRFRAPQPADGWEGLKDASKPPNSCYQVPDTAFKGEIHFDIILICCDILCDIFYLPFRIFWLYPIATSKRCHKMLVKPNQANLQQANDKDNEPLTCMLFNHFFWYATHAPQNFFF